MTSEVATLREAFQRLFVAHGNEVSGLPILRALRAPPGIEDRACGGVRQRCLCKSAHGAHGGNSVRNCGHGLLLVSSRTSRVTTTVYRTASSSAASNSIPV